MTPSPKWGVNATISVCRYCGGSKDEIVFLGRIDEQDSKAPERSIRDDVPCDRCAKFSCQGIVFISVKDGDEVVVDPHRTGNVCIIKRQDLVSVFGQDALPFQEMSFVFVGDTLWRNAGLPTQ